jgi:hypothetical protein
MASDGRASALRPLLLVWLAGWLGACTGLPGTGIDAALCWPAFPYRDGWLGADSAYSIRLSESESLWLFGDTFVGGPGGVDRRGAAFVHNSIGVSRCRAGGRWQIDYFWGRGADGTPRAFLERAEPDTWWWLFDGFLHAGRLYLGLLEVERAPPSGPLALPFAFTGAKLARVENPRDAPPDWRVQVLALSSGPQALPSAMVAHADHAWLFPFLDRGDGRRPRALARLPLRALAGDPRDVSGALEYLARDGTWKLGLDAADARVLMDDTATEMSVRFHPDLGQWLAVYSHPETDAAFPRTPASGGVWLRTAERLEGPWSERRLLFRVPEVDPAHVGGHDPNTACYAAKEHPQLASGRRLALTYVCNLFTGPGQDPNDILGRLLGDMGLYRPVPVALDLPLLRGAEP